MIIHQTGCLHKGITNSRTDKSETTFLQVPGKLIRQAGVCRHLLKISDTGMSSREFVSELYQSTGVSVLDASAFGASASGYVRVSYTPSDEQLEEACRRIQSFLEQRQG